MAIPVEDAKSLVRTLKNLIVINAIFQDDNLMLQFNDGSLLMVSVRSGPGADSNWYNWTEIILNGQTLLNK